MSRIEEGRQEDNWGEGRHSEPDAPHEEQEPGSLEEPETQHQPHEGEEDQRDEVT